MHKIWQMIEKNNVANQSNAHMSQKNLGQIRFK